jgi:hypothetical protein
MKLKFVINKEFDIEMTLHMHSLHMTSVIESEAISRKSLEEQYKKELPKLESKRKEFQLEWDKINDKFSRYVEKVTGYNWFYPEYECVLSFNIRGASNWGKVIWGDIPKIVRGYDVPTNSWYFTRITAHELILAHYFEIYRRYYDKEGLKDGQVWALAEIAAFALTSLTPEAKTFWSNTEYYTNHNYPQIVELQNELKSTFIKTAAKGDFDSYIKKRIELARRYSDMDPLKAVPSKEDKKERTKSKSKS